MAPRRLLLRFRLLALAAIAVLLLASSFPAAASAADLRSGDEIVIPAGERIRDDLYITATWIRIDGIVDGDVFAIGQTIVVNGQITGGLTAAAQTLTVNGTIGRGARVAAQTLTFNGKTGTDLWAAGSQLMISDQATIAGDLLMAAGQARLGGDTGGRLYASVGDLTIAGRIGGAADLDVGTLTLAGQAHVGGPIVYRSQQEAVVSPNATVGGVVQRVMPEPRETRPIETLRASIGWGVVAYLILVATGASLLRIIRQPMLTAVEVVRHELLPAIGYGAIGLVVPPVAIVVALIVVAVIISVLFGGGPAFAAVLVAIGLLAIWLIAVFFSQIVVALFLGRWLFGLMRQPAEDLPFRWLALGGVVLVLLGYLPAIGPLVQWLIVPLIGTGALAVMVLRHHRRPFVAPTQRPAPTPATTPA